MLSSISFKSSAIILNTIELAVKFRIEEDFMSSLFQVFISRSGNHTQLQELSEHSTLVSERSAAHLRRVDHSTDQRYQEWRGGDVWVDCWHRCDEADTMNQNRGNRARTEELQKME